MGLVYAPASTVLPVDLKDLVPKTQAGQGRRGVSLHQLDKHSLREERENGYNIQNESKDWEKRRETLRVGRKQRSNSRGRRQGQREERGPLMFIEERKDIKMAVAIYLKQ